MKYTEVCKENIEMMRKSKYGKVAWIMAIISLVVYVYYCIDSFITLKELKQIEDMKLSNNSVSADLFQKREEN